MQLFTSQTRRYTYGRELIHRGWLAIFTRHHERDRLISCIYPTGQLSACRERHHAGVSIPNSCTRRASVYTRCCLRYCWFVTVFETFGSRCWRERNTWRSDDAPVLGWRPRLMAECGLFIYCCGGGQTCIYLLPEVRCADDICGAESTSMTDRLHLVVPPSCGPVSPETFAVSQCSQTCWNVCTVASHFSFRWHLRKGRCHSFLFVFASDTSYNCIYTQVWTWMANVHV